MRGGERVSLLNSCPLTSFYKGRGRALINKHALSFGPVVNYFSILHIGETTDQSPPWDHWERRVRDCSADYTDKYIKYLSINLSTVFAVVDVQVALLLEGVPPRKAVPRLCHCQRHPCCFVVFRYLLRERQYLDLVYEYAVSSLVTGQGPGTTSGTCPYKAPCSFSIGILLYDYLLTHVIRDKVRPCSAQYGMAACVSKYGTVPCFKGRLAWQPYALLFVD